MFTPDAGERPLAFQTALEWVSRAFVYVQTLVVQARPRRIAVLLLPELGEHRDRQTAPAELQPEVSNTL